VRRFYEALAAEPRVSTTALQTVGSNGYDGFSLALVHRDATTEATASALDAWLFSRVGHGIWITSRPRSFGD
jgi:hypothetical protein